MPVPTKNTWKHKNSGLRKAGVKPMGAILAKKRTEDAQKSGRMTIPLTMSEKLAILEYAAKGEDSNLIGERLNRTALSIRKFIERHTSTSVIARARLEGGAEILANRIVEQANVDQSLEVMDRLDILAKKRDKHEPSTSFSLIIGNPVIGGTHVTGTLPVPTQRQITDAIDAEVVKNG